MADGGLVLLATRFAVAAALFWLLAFATRRLRGLSRRDVLIACVFLNSPAPREQNYGAGMFSRAYRSARAIQTSSSRNFSTRRV